MEGLKDAGIRELGLLRRRVKRLYGMERLSEAQYRDLEVLMADLETRLLRYDDGGDNGQVPETSTPDHN